MSDAWTWLAVAALGALHGLNPASGWMFAAAWGVRARDRSRAAWALVPIAVGHTASVALVAAVVVFGLSMDRVVLQALAACLFAFVAIIHFCIKLPHAARAPAGHAGLALWSFLVSTAHGAGLMLVPALVPLCMGNATGGAISTSGSMALALAAIGVHTAAMLVVTGLIAAGVCRGWDAGLRYWRRPRPV